MTPRTVLAFDFGLRNIGVAAGQTVSRTAEPVTTLRARRGIPDWAEIDGLLSQWRPDLLLVGLPLNMDQSMSAMGERAQVFAAQLKDRSGLPVELVDERLTSYAARDLSRDLQMQHAIAAKLIAETYLSAGS